MYHAEQTGDRTSVGGILGRQIMVLYLGHTMVEPEIGDRRELLRLSCKLPRNPSTAHDLEAIERNPLEAAFVLLEEIPSPLDVGRLLTRIADNHRRPHTKVSVLGVD